MLKCRNTLSLSIAAACLTFAASPLAVASNSNAKVTDSTIMTHINAQQEAAQMVSAQVHLVETLDARKAMAGRQFEAVVDKTVHLKDGTELPHGTVLVGKVAVDQMHSAGTSRLALLFTEAKLRDGKTVPIRATIAGVASPADYATGYMSGAEPPPAWNRATLQIDQIDALNDIDLHSSIGGTNSGVFVTKKKDDVKLQAGSQLSLAIAAQKS